MNKTQIYMIVKNEFATKKATAEAVAFDNMQKVLKDPEFFALHKKERELIFDIAKNKSIKKPTEELSVNLKNVQNAIISRLKILNTPLEDLSPKYDCKICNDSGIKNGRTCKCFEKRIKERLIAESSNNISTLHNFSEYNSKIAKNQKHQDQLEKLSGYMKSWIDSTNPEKPNLICLSGKTGVGKTFLTECTATYALKRGKLVSMISAFGMNNIFLKYHTSKTEEKVSVLDTLMDPDLLIIDDLGTEPMLNNVTVEYLYLLISERCLGEKQTIITTNLSPDGILARYGERVFSRIFNKRQCKNFQIQGDDLRINK